MEGEAGKEEGCGVGRGEEKDGGNGVLMSGVTRQNFDGQYHFYEEMFMH
jgi:hypothetical protein